METTTQLYWLTRLDGLSTLFSVLAILSVLVTAFSSIINLCESTGRYGDEDVINKTRKISRTSLVITLILLPIAVLIPSKNDVIFIVAGGKTIDFIKNDTSINKIPAQTTKLITDYLDKQLEDKK